MKPASAYGDLQRMNRAIVTTREAAARWQTAQGTAGRRLRGMEEAGLVRRLRRGLWALDTDVAPFAVAPYLTAPFPAYVSFFSALSRHDMIEQIPRQISVASLDRAQRITTTVGTYEIHHLAPGSSVAMAARRRVGTWRRQRRLSLTLSMSAQLPEAVLSFPSSRFPGISTTLRSRNGSGGSRAPACERWSRAAFAKCWGKHGARTTCRQVAHRKPVPASGSNFSTRLDFCLTWLAIF